MRSRSGRARRLSHIGGFIALASSLPLGAFSYWGLYTQAGIRAYDEMDALYPFAAGALGFLLVLLGLLAMWFARRIGTRRP